MRLDQIQRLLQHTAPQMMGGAGVPGLPEYRGDAGETLAMARQLEYFYAKLYAVEYPDSMGRVLVPVDYSVPSGARSHTYRQLDEAGEADIIDSYAEDLPLVDETGKETVTKIVGLGAAFHISIQDLRSAAMLNINLDARKANSARLAMEKRLDRMICIGDSRLPTTGFANDANVPLVTPVTGSWATATAAQIQADIEKLCKSVYDSTLGLHGNPDNGTALTLVLPPTLYSRIAVLRIDTFNMITVLQYEKQNNPFVGDVRAWARLATAGAGGVPRVVAYQKHPDILAAVIPQEFEILPMQTRSLGYNVPTHMRFGGTIWRYPLAAAYMDGC